MTSLSKPWKVSVMRRVIGPTRGASAGQCSSPMPHGHGEQVCPGGSMGPVCAAGVTVGGRYAAGRPPRH